MAKAAQDIILRPVITEETMVASAMKKYTFLVAKDANKIEIAQAVEALFDVKVAKVNTLNVKGHLRRYGRFNFIPRPGTLPRDALMMEAQMPLGPRKGLMVVRFMNRRLLLAVTEQQICLLTEESLDHETPCQDFQHLLEQSVAASAHGAGADGSRP